MTDRKTSMKSDGDSDKVTGQTWGHWKTADGNGIVRRQVTM